MKRLLGIITAVIMLLSLVPAGVTAEGTRTVSADGLDEVLNVEGGSIHFVSEGEYPWEVVAADDIDHPDYAKSGNGGVMSSESVLTATVTAGEYGALLTFDFQALGEGVTTPWDKCIFSVDGAQKFARGSDAALGWQSWSEELAPGTHELEWKYTKDGTVNPEGDCFIIDNVSLTDLEYVEPTPVPTSEPTPEPVAPEVLDAALNVEGGTIHFVNDEVYPWTVEEDEEGRVYAQSGNIGVHSSVSSIAAVVNVEGEGMMVRFELMSRGEGYDATDWDVSRFFVDGEMVMHYGQHDPVWEVFEYALTPGEHTLRWDYKKDHGVSYPDDCFRVDNVEIVEGVPFEPEVISEISILGFSVPLWGAHPNFNVYVPEGAPYTIIYREWEYADDYGDDYGQLAEDEYFDNEYLWYSMLIKVEPNEGYVFADNVSANINGHVELISNCGVSILGGYFYIYTIDFEVFPYIVDPTPEPEGPATVYLWNFENNPEPQGWEFEDADGDGWNWEWILDIDYEYTFYEGDGFIFSASYDNFEGVLIPDNWAKSPEFVVPAEGYFSFYANAQDTEFFEDILGIYIIVDGEAVKLGDDIQPFVYPEEYIYDISAYAGQTVRIAFRHYRSVDQYRVNLDYVTVHGNTSPAPQIPGDANGDGSVDTSDALMVLRHALSIDLLDDAAAALCDMDGNGVTDTVDALIILRIAMDITDNK